jgi:hypothetical protein
MEVLTGGPCSDGSHLMEIRRELEGRDPVAESVIRRAPYTFYAAQYDPFRPVLLLGRLADRKVAEEYAKFYQLMQAAEALPLYLG